MHDLYIGTCVCIWVYCAYIPTVSVIGLVLYTNVARRITENDRVIVTRTGDLLITSLSPLDEGYYSCLARNAEGQAEGLALLDIVGFKGNTSGMCDSA